MSGFHGDFRGEHRLEKAEPRLEQARSLATPFNLRLIIRK